MITATDSARNGGGNLDAFRIKIRDIDNGDAVVYDNQVDEVVAREHCEPEDTRIDDDDPDALRIHTSRGAP